MRALGTFQRCSSFLFCRDPGRRVATFSAPSRLHPKCSASMQENSGASVGLSSAELPASSEFAPAAAAAAAAPGSPGASARFSRIRHEDSAVLKLKGLPYTTQEQQLLDFFKGYNIKTIAFVYEPDGRPSGLAFAEFETREEALRAMSKNGEYIGERYVRLLHVPKQEMEEQVRLGTLAVPGAAAKYKQRRVRPGFNAEHMPLLPPPLPLQHVGGPRPILDLAAQLPPSLALGPSPLPGLPPASGSQADVSSAHLPPPNMGLPQMNPHMALIYQLSSLNLAAARPPQAGLPPMMQPPAFQAGALPLPLQPIPRMVVPDTKTVKVRGLPFRATPLDILSFFDGYQFIAESLQIGVDTLGRPSGEAWLSFSSADEAMRAVRERNRHYLGSRYLELSVS